MEKLILVKNGELALKGLNRSTFEDILIKNMRRRLRAVGEFEYKKSQSTIMVVPKDEDIDFDEAVDIISRIFGIAAFSVAGTAEKDIEKIKQSAAEFLEEDLANARTFKVCAKRSDKKFPFKSPEICREVGGYLLSRYPNLKVDVHNPEVTVTVEVRDTSVFIHGNQQKGAGGMPVGTSGKAALMLSGGIDSPVAGYMMSKRGLILDAIHFAAPPYTSKRAEMKVRKLASLVSHYSGKIKFMIVPFTQIQECIKDNCPEELFTVIMRRLMMKVALGLCEKDECKALITGESLGQVASQTLDAIRCTDAVSPLPVFRPLIGMDKLEIIDIARKIGTFETSLEPYEDCCTVFTPRHPMTRPTLEVIEKAESGFDFEPLIKKAIEETTIEIIG